MNSRLSGWIKSPSLIALGCALALGVAIAVFADQSQQQCMVASTRSSSNEVSIPSGVPSNLPLVASIHPESDSTYDTSWRFERKLGDGGWEATHGLTASFDSTKPRVFPISEAPVVAGAGRSGPGTASLLLPPNLVTGTYRLGTTLFASTGEHRVVYVELQVACG